MHTVTNPSTARYLASQALLDGGFSHEQVGRAMLALDAVDPDPETELEIEAYEPTEDDYRDYELYLERLEAERGCDAWTVCTIR